MISVLIPVYNYNVKPLVENLISQLNKQNIEWEILLSDDESIAVYKKVNNNYINSLNNFHIKLFLQEQNVGNGANKYKLYICKECSSTLKWTPSQSTLSLPLDHRPSYSCVGLYTT